MELRVLQYFLAVAREQSISGAAESSHLSHDAFPRAEGSGGRAGQADHDPRQPPHYLDGRRHASAQKGAGNCRSRTENRG